MEEEFSVPREENKEIKEFAILQGGLKAILSSLIQASEEVQIDLIGMITKLLTNDEKYQLEFKRINGYILLDQIFNRIWNYNDPQTLIFLVSMFELLKIVILNGNGRYLIKNFDAFKLLLNLIGFSNKHEIESHALNILEQILQLSWKNIIISRQLDVHQILMFLYMKKNDLSDLIPNNLINRQAH